jgi:hypothetical protein
VTPPDEPVNPPEDYPNEAPDGSTQPLPTQPPPVPPTPTQPYPGPPDPYGQPGYGQPTYGQPPYGQPTYGQPTSGQPPYSQPPYGQPAYGQPAYGQSAYPPPGYATAVPDHPSATTAMVLGLIGLIGTFVACGITVFLCPFAWRIGARAKREIDESNGALGGRDKAMVGYVTGIIGTVLMILGFLGLLVFLAVLVVAPSSSTTY